MYGEIKNGIIMATAQSRHKLYVVCRLNEFNLHNN